MYYLQLQQPQLSVFLVCRPSRVQQVVDGGQGQGRSVQHMKQTFFQCLMGDLGTDRLVRRHNHNMQVFSQPGGNIV